MIRNTLVTLAASLLAFTVSAQPHHAKAAAHAHQRTQVASNTHWQHPASKQGHHTTAHAHRSAAHARPGHAHRATTTHHGKVVTRSHRGAVRHGANHSGRHQAAHHGSPHHGAKTARHTGARHHA